MWPTFKTPFGIIDDHEIIEIIGRRPRLPASEFFSTFVSLMNEQNGRFRPVYWFGRALECVFAGRDPTWWHVDRFLMAAVTLTAIYVAAAQFMHPLIAAPLSLLPLLGPQFETWYRLGPNEAYAMPLFTVGIALLSWGLVRRMHPSQLWAAYALLILSGLAKENFAPAVLIITAWTALHFGFSKLTARDRLLLAGVTVVVLIDLAVVLVKVSLFGGVYVQDRSVETGQNWLYAAFGSLNLFTHLDLGLVLVAVLLVATRCIPLPRRRLVEIIGLTAAVASTQAAFYADGPLSGRYLYPFALIPVLLWGLVGSLCRAAPPGRIKHVAAVILSLVLLLSVVTGGAASRSAGELSAQDAVAFTEARNAIERRAERTGVSMIVIQPWDRLNDSEKALSLERFISSETELQVIRVPAEHHDHARSRDLVDDRLEEPWGYDRSRLTPYLDPDRCMSLLFEGSKPLCSVSAPAPGQLILVALLDPGVS